MAKAGLFDSLAPRPLADRMRPKTLEEVVGQDHVLAPDAALGRMLASGRLASIVLWGPPGCGKTTIARLLAERTDLHFEPLSAVFSGVADLRKAFEAARERRIAGRGTLLFVDEIHRFNRAQQDGFLPFVEDGTVVRLLAPTVAGYGDTNRVRPWMLGELEDVMHRLRMGGADEGTEVRFKRDAIEACIPFAEFALVPAKPDRPAPGPNPVVPSRALALDWRLVAGLILLVSATLLGVVVLR